MHFLWINRKCPCSILFMFSASEMWTTCWKSGLRGASIPANFYYVCWKWCRLDPRATHRQSSPPRGWQSRVGWESLFRHISARRTWLEGVGHKATVTRGDTQEEESRNLVYRCRVGYECECIVCVPCECIYGPALALSRPLHSSVSPRLIFPAPFLPLVS